MVLSLLWSSLATIAPTVSCPNVPADFDHDCDVDHDDFSTFQSCVSGPTVPHDGSEACQQADLEPDGDVDQADFGILQRCFSGENYLADPNCVN